MGAYFLAFKGGDVPQASLHLCYLAEDLTGREMEILQQVMERNWGYDEELADAGNDWYEFQVVGATADTVCFVELRQQWAAHLQGRQVGNWNYTIQHLRQSAEEYAIHIRSARSQIPRGYFLTADYGGGEGEVFNFVDNLTDQEIDILEELLRKYIYEQGGTFHLAAKDELAVDHPARCVHLQWDWDILK